MARSESAHDEEPAFGSLVLRRTLPTAIRSLENDELRALLLALLEEWRWRAQGAQSG